MRQLFLTAALQFFASLAYTQWQPDVRLTNNTAESYTSYGAARSIAADGDTVHIVWFDSRDGNPEIYYKQSTDGGITWNEDTRLTNSGAETEFPAISVSESNVHVVWGDTRDGGDLEIYYMHSTDGGVTWNADIRLTDDNNYSSYPSCAVSAEVVHVVWEDYRDGNLEIYYKRSEDGGLTWSTDARISDNSYESENPSVAVSGSTVHIVWNDDRHGANEVYYKRSINGGVTWGAETRLTNDPAFGNLASLAVSGTNVHLTWYDERDGNREIYYKNSTDDGISWGSDTRLTTDTSASNSPSLSLVGSNVHLVFHDERDGNKEIYYKHSSDGGINWSSDTRLTDAEGVSGRPSILASEEALQVVWYDERDGNSEIYYKRNSTGGSVDFDENPSPEFQFSVYPNPANSFLNLEFSDGLNKGTIEIFSILGERVFSEPVISSSKKEINLKSFSQGIYLLTMFNGKEYFSKRILITKG
ncbi:MAG: exo-alpha-sialidase [Chitinophagales bacterium]